MRAWWFKIKSNIAQTALALDGLVRSARLMFNMLEAYVAPWSILRVDCLPGIIGTAKETKIGVRDFYEYLRDIYKK